ncbi:hypothetical protein NQ315_001871 [Exocentrus adspersus]|uniref:Uncharacterized protein n=1 Tax=Exocentrus adspersus TaxID=1586481 RepID=A0AAV8WAH2_9CUCU|nr:hypothetical protein NQ315_001871 [Exocentrus adspersus]
MTKKRKFSSSSPVKIEVKEENVLGNDYLMAKGRLKGVLKQLTERSSDEDSNSSDENTSHSDGSRKRKSESNMPAPYHHTYVMKLFDRSVDLARFEEDTPLYPICRAWMQNQPRNPQMIIKRRVSSPEPENSSWNENSISDVTRLPPPTRIFTTRIPSPTPEQVQNKDNINLNYDDCPVVEKNELISGHLQRWVKILQAIYNKAQENME